WAVTVGTLLGDAPSWQSAATYADQLAELHRRRRITMLANTLAIDPSSADVAGRLVDALQAPTNGMAASAPFAGDLDALRAERAGPPDALVGNTDTVLLPVGGLLILFAKGGRGKTTLTIDLALHAASGVDWLGFRIGRPLRVLFVENEGPRESFR